MNLKSYNSLKINTTNIKTLKCLFCVVIHHCRFDWLREHGHSKFWQCLHADHNVVMWTSFFEKAIALSFPGYALDSGHRRRKKSTFKSNHCYLMYISVWNHAVTSRHHGRLRDFAPHSKESIAAGVSWVHSPLLFLGSQNKNWV